MTENDVLYDVYVNDELTESFPTKSDALSFIETFYDAENIMLEESILPETTIQQDIKDFFTKKTGWTIFSKDSRIRHDFMGKLSDVLQYLRKRGYDKDDVYVHDTLDRFSQEGINPIDYLQRGYKAVVRLQQKPGLFRASDEDPTDDESLSVDGMMEMYEVYEAEQYHETFGSQEEAEEYIESYALQDAKIYKLNITDDMMVHEDEYDDVDMAMSQTYKIGNYADELMEMLQEEDELEAWVQSKITKASDYLSSVVHYLEYQQEKSTSNF